MIYLCGGPLISGKVSLDYIYEEYKCTWKALASAEKRNVAQLLQKQFRGAKKLIDPASMGISMPYTKSYLAQDK